MKKKLISCLVIVMMLICMTGCASLPSQALESNNSGTKDISIAATSVAICEILDALEYDNVIAVPETSGDLPERYAKTKTIGSSMNPDLELVKSVNPDLVLSPQSLETSLAEQYTSAGISSAFLDLSSVQGMYNAIDSLGELLGKEERAAAIRADYESYMGEYTKKEAENNSCMILMCFPDGFYLLATEKSYVGNLVELAGGENVYANYEGDENGIVSINPEDMIQKNPDKIFVFAHYDEESAFSYMKEEFETNTTWQYYDAVKNGKVYYLPAEYFGMSATFEWTEAMDYLYPIFYEE